MYCVFLETGNDKFFSCIVDAFCEKIVQSVIDLYKSGVFTGLQGMVDMKRTEEYFQKNGNALYSFDCCQYANISCDNAECKTGHITALASNQIAVFEYSMAEKILVLTNGLNHIQRLNIQRLFQIYRIAAMQQFVEINLKSGPDHNTYLRSYVKKTNLLKKIADNFVYVRARPVSDYDYFKKHTKLPNIKACGV